MADLSLQRTAKTAGRPRGRPFEKGRSGNPVGRPRGSTNRTTSAAALLLEGEAEALARKAVELALGGDAAALRLCLDRLVAPRRGRAVELALPVLDSASDVAAAMAAIAAAATNGAITPDEALALSQTVETFIRALDAREAERREQRRMEMYAAMSGNSIKASGGAS
jgi:hypothetical protein